MVDDLPEPEATVSRLRVRSQPVDPGVVAMSWSLTRLELKLSGWQVIHGETLSSVLGTRGL